MLSIVLGYDHYAGYLQKIRTYLTEGLRVGKKAELVRSPLKAGAQDQKCHQHEYR